MQPARQLVRHDARLLLLLVAAGVVGLTLYPLRLIDSTDRYLAGLAGVLRHPVDLMSPVHLVPAAVMTLLAVRAWPAVRPRRLALTVLAGLLLLEAVQPLILYRHARLGDIAMQAAGVVVGLMLARRGWLDARRLGRSAGLIWAGILACSVAAVLLLGLRAQVGHDIGPVDPSYRVTVGSEVGGERPWVGSIHGVAMYAADIRPTDAAWLAGNPIAPGAIAQRRDLGPCMIYDFVNSGARIDGVVQVPDLGSAGAPLYDRGAVLTAMGLDTAEGPAIASRENVGAFSEAAQARGAVTIEASVTPRDTRQSGPARIVTVSNGVGVRNFTLAQDGDGLELRVRTGRTGLNASRSTFRFPGVMQAGRRVHLVLVSTGDHAELFVNGAPAGERVLFVGPGAWLGLVPSWGDVPACVAFFAPLGIAAAGAIRRRAPTAVVPPAVLPVGSPVVRAGAAGALSAAVVVGIYALAAARDRPTDPAVLLMAVSIAVLAAILAAPRPRTNVRSRTDPEG